MIDLSMVPDFIVEAHEHLEEVEWNLIQLDRSEGDPEIINNIFRAMHTIKGAAQFIGVERVAELSHKLENVLELVRQGERKLDHDIIDTLIAGKDRISLLVNEVDRLQQEETEIGDVLDRIRALEEAEPDIQPAGQESQTPASEHNQDSDDTVIELTDNLGELFTTSEKEDIDSTHDTEVDYPVKEDNAPEQQPASALADLDIQFDIDDIDHWEPAEKEEAPSSTPSVLETERIKPEPGDERLNNTGKHSSAADSSDIDIEPLKKEIAAEDLDDELFQIFIQQLQESITLLKGLTETIQHSSRKQKVVDQCSDLLGTLHSSANYMGYDWLAKFYSRWIAELEMTDLQMSTGGDVSFDFMNSRIDVIAEIFPQVAHSLTVAALAEDAAAVPRPLVETGQDKTPDEAGDDQDYDELRDLFSSIDDSEDQDFAEDLKIVAVLADEQEPSPAPLKVNHTLNNEIFTPEAVADTPEIKSHDKEPAVLPTRNNEKTPTTSSTAKEQNAVDLTALLQELEGEDFNDDLVQIFLEQLQEHLSLLSGLATDFYTAPGKSKIVEQCSELVEKLHSSANYMGYDRLAEFYEQWIAELEMTDLELSIGTDVEFDFMDRNIETICNLFPQIKMPEEKPPSAEREPNERTGDGSPADGNGISATDLPPQIIQENGGETPPAKPEAGDAGEPDTVEDEFDLIKAAFAGGTGEDDIDEEEDLNGEFDHIAETFEHDQEKVAGKEEKPVFITDETDPFADDAPEDETGPEEDGQQETEMDDDLFEPLFDAETEETQAEEVFFDIDQADEDTGESDEIFFDIDQTDEDTDESGEDLFDIDQADEDTGASGEIFFDIDRADEDTDESGEDLFDIDQTDEDTDESGEDLFDIDQTDEDTGASGEIFFDIDRADEDTSVSGEELFGIEEDSEVEFDDRSGVSQDTDSISAPDPRRTELFAKLSDELDALVGRPEDKPIEELDADTLLELLHNEIESDTADRDLFEIYINQIQDSIPTLRKLNDDFEKSDNKQKILEECSIIIDALRSSSNYMDYVHFERFYHKWLEQIAASEEQLSREKSVILPYMTANIGTIMDVFPQLSITRNGISDTAADTEEKQDTPDEAPYTGMTQPDADDMPTDEKQLFDRLSSALDLEVAKIQQEEFTETLAEDHDQQLFDRLSSALETSPLDHTPATLKPIDDVINEILTGTGFARPSDPDITIKKTTEESAAFIERRTDFSDRRQGLMDRRQAETESPSKARQSIRVDTDKIDFLMDQVGELVVNRSYITQLHQEMNAVQEYYRAMGRLGKDELKPLQDHVEKLNEASIALGRVSNEMQDGVMNVRMMPVSQLFKRFSRLIHDLANNTGKEVRFEMAGEETQLDKTVIEEVSDPLIHLIRNSIDHGIETVEERKAAGKEETAVIRIEAYPDSSNIVMEITDDGRGIDPSLIKAKALEKNILPARQLEAMTDEELTYLIMTPGFSTAEKTTRTSGRGVGMDVVRTNIEKLNGTIEIESRPGYGTMIRARIPLTLAIIQTLGVRVGSRVLSLPLTSIDETARISVADIGQTEGMRTFTHRDDSLPLLQLGEILNIQTEENDKKHLFVVIVKSDGQRVGLIVDKFLGMDESVIKPLADYLRKESGFSGATIKGDGTISLILDIPTLLAIVAQRQPTSGQRETLVRLMKGSAHD